PPLRLPARGPGETVRGWSPEMPNAASSVGPDLAGSLSPEYRIEGEFAVRAVLRELMARRSLVTLYPEGRVDDALVTRIVHVAPDGVELDASGQPGAAEALRRADFAIGVAYPQNVKKIGRASCRER